MPDSQAMIGYGSKFMVENDTTPGVFDDLAEVTNITPPNQQVDDVDVTHNQSPNRNREFIPGLTDPGDTSFEMNFVPGSDTDIRILALKDAGTKKNWRIQYPNGKTWDFLGYVKGYEPSAATEDKMSATVSIKVSGSTTRNY